MAVGNSIIGSNKRFQSFPQAEGGQLDPGVGISSGFLEGNSAGVIGS